MTQVAVMGAGSWGTAFAALAIAAGSDVRLWARREEVAAEVNDRHTNHGYLPDAELPGTLRATADPTEALAGADEARGNVSWRTATAQREAREARESSMWRRRGRAVVGAPPPILPSLGSTSSQRRSTASSGTTARVGTPLCLQVFGCLRG